jgi:4'-phosphopantetheinyl transferase
MEVPAGNGISGASELKPFEVHVWSAWLNQSEKVISELDKILSPDERERASRFLREKSRLEFIVSRGLLRKILAQYTNLETSDLIFIYSENGKPSLAPQLRRSLFFNVSHSAGLVLFAFSAQCEVGIDVEQIRPISEADEIAERFFSHEEALKIKAETERKSEIFYQLWTRKEAFLKCSGTGIAHGLHQRMAMNETLICDFVPEENYIAALAVARGPVKILHQRWNGELGSEV